MEVQGLSTSFEVRVLLESDVDIIYDVCRGNEMFYQYHPPFVTRESIIEDMRELPQGKTYSDKFFLGFFKEESLIAFMDLILGYPSEETAYIGLFMVSAGYQGGGVGSAIVRECISYLCGAGYTKFRLGTDIGNPQSNAFWMKNGFVQVRKKEKYIIRELLI